MRNQDKGTGELLGLLKTKPELVSALVFDTRNIKRLLKSKAARRLVLGVDTRAFLRSVVGPAEGGPIAFCDGRAAVICRKRTK
jgi:hypothetical protein